SSNSWVPRVSAVALTLVGPASVRYSRSPFDGYQPEAMWRDITVERVIGRDWKLNAGACHRRLINAGDEFHGAPALGDRHERCPLVENRLKEIVRHRDVQIFRLVGEESCRLVVGALRNGGINGGQMERTVRQPIR